MSDRETVHCPNCQGTSFDASHWRSREEKQRNGGSRPVRCRVCGHRFLAPVGQEDSKVPVAVMVGGAITLALVVLVAVVVAWSRSTPNASDGPDVPEPPAAVVSTAMTPAAMTAAEAGDPDAQYAVASAMLADSTLSLAYATKAIGFLQQAAERGHTRAMLRLGLVYRKGIEAPQNYALAAKWIEKSARLGEPQAMLELGRLHREGVGLPMDLVKAYIWLNRAAAARDTEAPRERAEVARHLTPTELQQAQDESTAGHFDSASATVSGAKMGPAAAPTAQPAASVTR
jgi:uncharacterized protein